MKSISTLQLFPRAARTLLLMVAIILAPMAVGGAELSGSWSDEANRNTSWGSDYETATTFTVNSEADLAQLAYLVNNGSDFSGKTITLAKDLDLSAHEWVSIGYFDATNSKYYSFKGIFDGGNYSISGMTINKTGANVLGLFGTIDNGAIIRNVILTSGSVTGNASVGGIVGEIQNSACQIINCHVLPGVTISGNRQVGGIAGEQYGTISGCSSGASANAEDSCGGLIGFLNKSGSTSLANCFYYGPDKTYAIVGRNFQTNTNVSHCFYAANAERGVDELDDSKDKAARVYSVTAGEGVTISRSGTAAATYYDGKLKFYGDDGCSFDGTEYATEGTTLTVSTTSVFEGYHLAFNVQGTGATISGEEEMTKTLTVGTADVTVSAVKGTPIDYTITYNLDGGTASNPLTYTVKSDDITLSNPIKAGYTFTGWSGTGLEGEANMNVTIAKGSTGERSYTAHWTSATGDTNSDWNGHAATSFTTINYDSKTLSITSEEEMALLSKYASTYADYTVTLTADINLKDYFWTPIAGFNGTFDGQGHKISGVMINSTAEQQGLFGTIGTAATVKNLVIDKSSITGGNNTGAVVGMADGDIENCHVLGDVIIAGTNFSNHGGIAGYGGGDINYCTSAAIMTATESVSYSGGIVGTSVGSVSKCLYYGTNLHNDMDPIRGNGTGENDNYQTYSSSVGSSKFVRVYNGEALVLGAPTNEYADTGYKVYEKGVSYGGKFYTAVVAMTEDGITDLTAYAGQDIDVAFGRSFDALGTSTGTVHAATICLPFSFAKPEASVGKFYTFDGVTGSGDDYTVTMTVVSGTEITAGTPYMFVPAGSGATVFENAAFYVPTEGFTAAGKTENGGWAFTGTYTKLTWASGQTRLYGFAGKNFQTGDGLALNDIGAFQRFGYGTTGAFRCYLMAPEAAGTRGSGAALPETMRVVLKGADGSITGIGTIDTMTGEATLDGNGPWYTLGGQYLQGKPSRPGIYIHNGKKVVIK